MGRKLKNVILSTCAITASIHCINKLVYYNATRKELLDECGGKKYNTKFGNVFYSIYGEGSSLLLLHDIDCASSGYEWNNIVDKLSKNHRVYVLDLLGCGRSDKPEISYTTYLYVQNIKEFIENVIGQSVDIVATGKSASVACMIKKLHSNLVDKIVAISPEYINKYSYFRSDKIDIILKKLFNSPIIGTLIYNFKYSKNIIEENFEENYFLDKKNIINKYINVYYEASHLGGSSTKYLFTSLYFNYLYCNSLSAIEEFNPNDFLIILGSDCDNYDDIYEQYSNINGDIKIEMIIDAKALPQLEKPYDVCKVIDNFLE